MGGAHLRQCFGTSFFAKNAAVFFLRNGEKAQQPRLWQSITLLFSVRVSRRAAACNFFEQFSIEILEQCPQATSLKTVTVPFLSLFGQAFTTSPKKQELVKLFL